MINQIDSVLWFKLNGVLRSYIAHGGLLNLAEIYVVTEYPKSGGTWLSQMLSTALDVPFPRNRLPMPGDSLLHGHYSSKWNIKHPIILWRDGRDVLVSQYFHIIHLSRGSTKSKEKIKQTLNFSDINDIESNLPKFIEYMLNSDNHKHFTWPEYVDYWTDTKNAIESRYEWLRENPAKELKRILFQLKHSDIEDKQIEEIVEKFSFKAQTGRKPGEENRSNFLRKGIVGDWKNSFNQEARKVFNSFAGKQLIKLGYEKNDHWCN